MRAKPTAAFLDFATLGPAIDTAALEALVDVEYFPHSSPAEAAERIRSCHVAIVNKARITAAALDRAAELRLIVLAATGTDNVDVEAARARGVAVANIRDYCTASVVQHVFALMLSLTQHVDRYDGRVRAGAWQRSDSFALFDHPIRELAGRRLGIVGHGALGRGVAAAATCFGMQVLISARPRSTAVPAGRVPFETVLERTDVLSLHCPLTEATRGLIGASELDRMQPDALLINTARGALIDGPALIDALRAGRIAGAGIDVLETEPPRDDEPLLAAALPNLLLTPHIAWAACEARQRALDQVAENIRDFLEGGRLRRVD